MRRPRECFIWMGNPLIANEAERDASVKYIYISRIAFSRAAKLEQYYIGLA
jgi:hypothetical protein